MTVRFLTRRARTTAAAVTVALLATALAAGCGSAVDGSTRGSNEAAIPEVAADVDRPEWARRPALSVDDNPLAGVRFYVEPDTLAMAEVIRARDEGREDDARLLDRIAGQPVAHWLTDADPAVVRADAETVVRRAAAADRMPVLVAYAIPGRDCGGYSAGGTSSADAYREWIRAVAAGIGARPAVVILEPDAVADTLKGCAKGDNDRYDLLSDAVTVLRGLTGTYVYLDAGNPVWVPDISALAGALRRSGVREADGLALNVANFVTIKDNLRYGNRLSDALDNAHFVIDTSRNGNGPWPGGGTVNGAPAWCNPPGRMLGAVPSADAGLPRVDALLWVKRPGESDGACRAGEPTAGTWWPEYALDLARQSS